MAPHPNRSRVTVDPGGNWRIYTLTLPEGAIPIGTITRATGESGALAYIERTQRYVQVNAGTIRNLDQRKVSAALHARA